MDKNQEYAIKVMLDDITFMLFDLERGSHIEQNQETPVDIGENFAFTYKRELVSETIENGWKNIVSNFHITCYKNDVVITSFVTYGGNRKFTLHQLEGFMTGIFIDKLEAFRKQKFSINNE